MPGKDKDLHRSSKSGTIKESQRVRTDRYAEEKRSSKREESSKIRAHNLEEQALRRAELDLPDSKKVHVTEGSKVEAKKSKSRHRDAEEPSRKSRSNELAIPDVEEDSGKRKKKSKHRPPEDDPPIPENTDYYESGKSRKSKHKEKLEQPTVPDEDYGVRKHRKSKSKSSEMDIDYEEYSAPKVNKKPPETPEKNNDYDYEDDFEDYQDDFDDDNEFEDEPVAVPVNNNRKPSPQAENASKPSSSDSCEAERTDNRKQQYFADKNKPSYSSYSQPSYGLNFKAAIQRTSKLSRRATDLLRLVTFDITRVDFFDFPEVSEYDRYIMSYGRATRKQTGTQTFDDAISRESQTEKLYFSSKWTQSPPEEEDEHSGVDATADSLAVQKRAAEDENLVDFMKDAGTAIFLILEETSNRQAKSQMRKAGGGKRRVETKFGATFGNKVVSFSQASAMLDDTYCLEQIFFPPQSSSYLISLHGLREGEVDFAHPHKIAVWSTSAVPAGTKAVPEIVVSSGVRVTCIAMESALNPELLFAGHIDGSLAVWDFRMTYKNNTASFRSSGVVATSSTVFSATDTHLAPLKCFLPLPLSMGSSLTESQAGLRCELLSLDESGLLATWAVADLGAASIRVMSDDPAVTPGGRIRLLRSSFGNITSSLSLADGLLEPTCMINHPTSPSRVLIGMSSGDVLHVARYGGRKGGLGSAHPSLYTRKFVSPVLNLAHFITAPVTGGGTTAGSDITGAFIASTALGFCIYVTSRSQPVFTFEPEGGDLLRVFPISSSCALSVLGTSSAEGIMATIAALSSDGKIYLYQIGPKFANQWSGAAGQVPGPSPSVRGALSRTGSDGPTILSMQLCIDTSATEDDEEDTRGGARRYLSAVAFPSGAIDIYLSEQDTQQSGVVVSPRSPREPSNLIDYLLTVV